jgi:hypothetical protein
VRSLMSELAYRRANGRNLLVLTRTFTGRLRKGRGDGA